jgi:hypothetical protein
LNDKTSHAVEFWIFFIFAALWLCGVAALQLCGFAAEGFTALRRKGFKALRRKGFKALRLCGFAALRRKGLRLCGFKPFFLFFYFFIFFLFFLPHLEYTRVLVSPPQRRSAGRVGTGQKQAGLRRKNFRLPAVPTQSRKT